MLKKTVLCKHCRQSVRKLPHADILVHEANWNAKCANGDTVAEVGDVVEEDPRTW